MRNQEALDLLRAVTFEKISMLTAPTTGKEAPSLPQLGDQAGTKAQMSLRSASENAQAAQSGVQQRVMQGAKGYSPPTGRKGTTGIGQSVQTVQSVAPKAKKLVQPQQRGGEGSRKVASVIKVAQGQGPGLLARLFGAGRPLRTATQVAAAADEGQAVRRVSTRGVYGGFEVPRPLAPGNWKPDMALPKQPGALRDAVNRYSARGAGQMTESEMKAYLQGLQKGPQGTVSAGRFASAFGGPLFRQPSPPMYATQTGGIGDVAQQIARAFGVRPSMASQVGNFASNLMGNRAGAGADATREVIAPAIKGGYLTSVPRALAGGAQLAGLYGLYKGGRYLLDRYSQPGGGDGAAGAPQMINVPMTPAQKAGFDAQQQNVEIARKAREKLGIPQPTPRAP